MTIIDQKVREKVAEIFREDCGRKPCASHDGYVQADRILQSPHLRVTLVEPRFCVSEPGLKPVVVRRDEGIDEEIAIFRGHSVGRQLAKEYADWLNSKEPR